MKILNLGCGHKISETMINVDFVSDNTRVVQHNLLKPLPFEDNSIDIVYHSNVLEHFSQVDGARFIKENVRVLKVGGILRCVVPDLEDIAKEYLFRLSEAKEYGVDNKYRWIIIELLDQLVRHSPGGEMSKFLSNDHQIDEYVEQRIGAIKAADKYKGVKQNISLKKAWRLISRQFSRLLGAHHNLGRFRAGGECHLWMYDELSLSQLLLDCGLQNIRRITASESRDPRWLDCNLDLDEKGRPIDPTALMVESTK